jgi:hypothetical protein
MTSHIFKIGVQIALAFFRRRGVQMADGDGQRIGGVGGFGDLIEIQKARHHLLDLMLFGPTVSDHRGLDGERRVFGDFDSGGSGGQHGDTAHLAEFQGGFHVGGVENVFDGDAVGAVLGDEFLKADRNAREARGHWVARGNFDGAAGDADEAVIFIPIVIVAVVGEQFDYAVSCVFRAAIDAEDAHEGSVAGGRMAFGCWLLAVGFSLLAFRLNNILVFGIWLARFLAGKSSDPTRADQGSVVT